MAALDYDNKTKITARHKCYIGRTFEMAKMWILVEK